MYTALLFVHIVCAVIWVGGAFSLQLLAVLVGRTGDPAELARLMGYFERIGSRVFVPVATLLFIAGAAMTLQAWCFGKTWIALSVALWVLSAVAGAIYLGPRAKRVGELFDCRGADLRSRSHPDEPTLPRLPPRTAQFRDRDRADGVQARDVSRVA